MGEVYRAHDEKLDRDVALKVLPEGALQDEEARKRFRKEAHALSRLSHPHIATILDFDTQDGTDFLAMELVRGHSLRDELDAKGPLPEKTVVRLGSQIAHGLQAAHEQGIIHRDLKPSNLQLTPDGLVRILDFGLARFVATGAGDSEETAPTETAVGRAAGTLPYMSPEQLRGRGVDTRTDLYAVGAVLYELATGHRLFSKESAAELTEAILSESPAPPRALNDRLSPGLDAVILKALDKDPELRYQTAKELLVDLERLQQRPDSPSSGSGPVTAPAPAPVHARKWRRLALGATGALVVGILAVLLRPTLPPPEVTHTRQITDDAVEKNSGLMGAALATDGSRVFFTARQSTGSSIAEVSCAGGDTGPFGVPFAGVPHILDISPDRSELLVVNRASASTGDYPLWLVPVPAGSPRRLGEVRGHGGTWTPDGQRIVYASGTALHVMNDDGTGSEELVTIPGSGSPWQPRFSPDGKRLRFHVWDRPNYSSSLWEVAADGSGLRPVLPSWSEPATGSSRYRVPPGECCGNWTPDGRYFVFQAHRDGRSDIWAIRESPGLLHKGSGGPFQLTKGSTHFLSPVPSTDRRTLFVESWQPRGELVRFDVESGRFAAYLGGISAESVSFSADGQWVAHVAYPEGVLWRSRLDGSERLQLTQPPMRCLVPNWSPDGRRIAFSGRRPGGGWSPYMISATGGVPELLANDEGVSWSDPTWSPDGTSILVGETALRSERRGIRVVSLSTGQATLLPGSEQLTSPRWSPDGRYVAAVRIGSRELHLFDFTTQEWEMLFEVADPEVQMVTFPTWSSDGSHLYLDRRGDNPEVIRIRISDRKVEIIVSLVGFRQTGYFQMWLGLTPDDSPLLLRDISIDEIYALDWEAP